MSNASWGPIGSPKPVQRLPVPRSVTFRPVPRVKDGNFRRRLAVAVPLGPDGEPACRESCQSQSNQCDALAPRPTGPRRVGTFLHVMRIILAPRET